MDVEISPRWMLNQVKDGRRTKDRMDVEPKKGYRRTKERMNVEPLTMEVKPYPGLRLNQAEDGW